jgi:acyl carrier protein phosphodiesterase
LLSSKKLERKRMNYLAHIYLSDYSEESMLGNFLGDFVNKSLENNFEYSIRNGIFMHRKLDSFTDSHPVFINSKRRVSTLNRRFAGVLIDMFYDHFLARNWSDYSPISLEEYSNNFYNILIKFSNCLPEKLTGRMAFMIEENWLLSYKEISGIERPLNRISRRFAKSNHPMINPIDELINNYEGLETDFKDFFPQAIEYANMLKTML